jgi:translation initiation factor 2 subunit 2
MDYDQLLKRAMSKAKTSVAEERLKIPDPEISISGKTTIIRNFGEIAGVVRRDPKHMSKFLFRELAIPGAIEENRLVLQRAFDREAIAKSLKLYYNEFVFCRECGKADTSMLKKDNLTFLKCEACGAERSVKKI